jgi:hypothetical protein
MKTQRPLHPARRFRLLYLLPSLIAAVFASSSPASADTLDPTSQSALTAINTDQVSEIIAGSSNAGTVSSPVYFPSSNLNMLPSLVGSTGTGGLQNLLKVSLPTPFYSGPTFSSTGPARASDASTTGTSMDGRFYTPAIWNMPLMLPVTSGADYTPSLTSAAYTPPRWILVAQDGSNPTQWSPSIVTSSTNSNPVVQRYAYSIYHEGGLLDANVAGYPSTSTTAQSSYKPALAYADLTQLGLTSAQVDMLVGWRNYASTQEPGASFLAPDFTPASASSYYQYITTATNGFLAPAATVYDGQTDRQFTSRQQLISFMQTGLGLSGTSLDVLNYLATFTRGLNQPSFAPDPARPRILMTGSGGNNAYGLDDQINPAFLTVKASGAFTRNNGSPAIIGEPLVNKRFALARLAWLTYQGPSALRNYTNPSSTPGNPDYDLWQLENLYGVPPSYLAQGTAANILQCFGLVWQKDYSSGIPAGFHDSTYKWFYAGHNTLGGTVNSSTGAISRLGAIAALGSAARDPDFFELLKSGISAGSKAKGSINLSGSYTTLSLPSSDPYVVQTSRDQSLDYSIIQLGANIIDQSKCDGYSTRIVFNDGTAAHEFRGVINQPYLYRVTTGDMKLRNESGPAFTGANITSSGPILSGSISDTGVGMIMQVPTIWNPHDINAPLGSPAPQNLRLVADSTQPEKQDNTGSNVGYTTFAASGAASTGLYISTQATTSTQYCPAFSYGPQGTGGLISSLVNSSNPQAVSALHAYLTFSATNPALYREPTILGRPNVPVGSNLSINALSTDYLSVENSSGQLTLQASGTGGIGFVSESSNPLNLPASAGASSTTRYVGIPLGLYPVAWALVLGGHGQACRSYFAYVSGSGGAETNLTYRMQYQDESGNWVTYDEKYVPITQRFLQTPFNAGSSGNLFNQASGGIGSGALWESFMDPRSARFCAIWGLNLGRLDNAPGGTQNDTAEWLDPLNDVLLTQRPDVNSGYGMSDDRGQNVGYEFSEYADLGWTLDPTPGTFLRQGLFTQNSLSALDNGTRFTGDTAGSSTGGYPEYYADPDGIVRPAMAAYVTGNSTAPAVTTIGLPTATAYTSTPATSSAQGQSRPYILHRPFRSVAELGYVFSGTPWKNLDFFTPSSGDAALLDVFTINDGPDQTADPAYVVAGRVNLNTRQEPVLKAILTGAYAGENSADTATTHPITASEADALLTAPNSLLSRTASTATGQGPLQNISEVVGRWVAPLNAFSGYSADLTGLYANALAASGTSTVATMQNIQRFRESAIRPLAAVGDTRVWDIMIDLIVQTGQYPTYATGLDDFYVTGEQRYWVHEAIDRFTGQIVDQNIESVGPTSLSLPGPVVAEGLPAGATVIALANYAPNSNGPFTYSLVTGPGSADNASFSINNGLLQTTGIFNSLTQSTYSILLGITDQNGVTTTKPLTVTIQPAPYTQWKIANFGPAAAADPTIAGDLINSQGDGLPNLVKYALGKSPPPPPPPRHTHP